MMLGRKKRGAYRRWKAVCELEKETVRVDMVNFTILCYDIRQSLQYQEDKLWSGMPYMNVVPCVQENAG